MNTEQLSFGQRIDPENGLIECWFSHGSLDWVKEQDFSEKDIIMFGGGLGDVWLSKRCKTLVVIERNADWLSSLKRRREFYMAMNLYYVHRPMEDCVGRDEEYMQRDESFEPDIIINDDAYRYEVCVMAEDYFKNKKGGGILITDNWMQSYVFICPAAEKLLSKYESKIFEQADHVDNDGINKWKTAIHFIK